MSKQKKPNTREQIERAMNKQNKPDVSNQLGNLSHNDTIYQALNDPQNHIKQLLKSIYRSGVTGTPRNLTQDLETITKLIQGDTSV